MSGSLPRWRTFLTILIVGQTNSDASDRTANIWLKIFSCGPRKSARNHRMPNVMTQRYTQLVTA
jgi:hypothetical protein